MTTEVIYTKTRLDPLSKVKPGGTFEFIREHYVRLEAEADRMDGTLACAHLESMRLCFLPPVNLVTPTDCTITITHK